MMPSMMFKLNENSIAAFKERGEWESVRKINHFTGYGLWMFWVHFAYLALFGIIALVWPSYPGLALTNWIADTFPYGVLAIANRSRVYLEAVFPLPVILHIVILHIITCTWLWIVTTAKLRPIFQFFCRNLEFWEIAEPKKWTLWRKVVGAMFSIISALLLSLFAFAYPFFLWPIEKILFLNDSEVAYLDWGLFFLWMGGPIIFWWVPLLFSLIAGMYIRRLLGYRALTDL